MVNISIYKAYSVLLKTISVFAVLGIEARAFNLLLKHPSTELHPSPLTQCILKGKLRMIVSPTKETISK